MDIHSITGSESQVEVLYPGDEEFKLLTDWMEDIIGEPVSKKMGYLGEIVAIVEVKSSSEDDDLHAYILQKDNWIMQITPVICRLSDRPILVIEGKEYDC